VREIQRADPVLRRRAVVVVGLVILGGVLLQATLGRWLEAHAGVAGPQERAVVVCALVAGVATVGGLILVVGGSLWRIGARTRRSRVFPPPGVRVVRDTVVLRDLPAVRRGLTMQLLAVALVLCVACLAVMTWSLVDAVTT
jgi:hypothetical protein